MYAIIQAGGRQVKVQPGSVVSVDRLGRGPDQEVTFEEVLFVEQDGGEILTGTPFIPDARVVGRVVGEARGPKIRVFKKKRRKGMRRTKGHRSTLTRVRISDIVVR